MNKIEIQVLPYDEEGVLNLLVLASSAAFSGYTEIYTSHNELTEFGVDLMQFPLLEKPPSKLRIRKRHK